MDKFESLDKYYDYKDVLILPKASSINNYINIIIY